jgi:glycosyltransferase involved in cell wall biosynthesis
MGGAIAEVTVPGGADLATLPKVSVCIGSFNQAAFVAAAIRSVAVQTYANFECLVIDDLSTDGSRASIETCLAELGDPRFRFLPREENGGQMVALMDGLDASDGTLVAFLDGDDLWHPRFLECHVAAHLSRAGIAAVSTSDEIMIDAAGVTLAGGLPNFRDGDPRRRKAGPRILSVVGEGDDTLVFVDRGASHWLWSTTSGMVFRRDALEMMRPARPERIRLCADAYLAQAAHMLGGTVRLERVLGGYRLHGSNGWAKQRLLGVGSEVGRMDPDLAATIRDELVEQWCVIAPRIEAVLPRRAMRRSLVEYLGREEAFRFFDRCAAASFLLDDWATPRRRRTMALIRRLPRMLRPRGFRPIAP